MIEISGNTTVQYFRAHYHHCYAHIHRINNDGELYRTFIDVDNIQLNDIVYLDGKYYIIIG